MSSAARRSRRAPVRASTADARAALAAARSAAEFGLRDRLLESGVTLSEAELNLLSSDGLGHDRSAARDLLGRFMSFEGLLTLGRDPAALGADAFAFVQAFGCVILAQPALLEHPRFGEGLMLAVRTARRVIVERQDELGAPQVASARHGLAGITSLDDLVRLALIGEWSLTCTA